MAFDHDATRYRYSEDVDNAPAEKGVYMILDGQDSCIYVTEDQIVNETISELESVFIQDYWSDGQAPCNDRR